MLKMLKHDIKESYFEVAVLNGILIGLSLLILMAIRVDRDSLFSVSVLLWALVLCAASFILLRNIINSFYSKIFTDRGYLTLTTPVSVDKILLSKIIVNMMWVLATLISIVISFLIVIQTLTSGTLSYTFDFFSILWQWMRENPLTAFKTVFYSLGYVLFCIMTLLLILVLTNTGRFKKHKILIGILIYIVLMTAISRITVAINNIDITFALSLVFSAGVYLLSRYLIIHKLELE